VHVSGTADISSRTSVVSEDSANDGGRQAFTIDGYSHADVLMVDGTGGIEGDTSALAGQAVTAGVTLASLAEERSLTGTLTLTAPTVVAGRAVIGVHGAVPAYADYPPGATATIYVAASGRPLPVSEQLTFSGGRATYTFSQWGESLHLTPPPNPVPVTSISSSPRIV
jgi:hypothetical protein